MARPLRIDRAGSWYHVTARGNERRDIYRDDSDCLKFLALLEAWVERYRLRLHAYVLMSNHYHLFIESVEPNLSRAMQWLNVSYSIWFNRCYGRVGHLFQGRFKAILVDEEQWGLELSRYIHLNPVRRQKYALDRESRQQNRAGLGREVTQQRLAERLEALRQYRWSSYRSYIGLDKASDWLVCQEVLKRVEGGKQGRHKNYRQYVEEALREGTMTPWEQLQGQVILGDRKFVMKLEEDLQGDRREQPSLRQLSWRPSWEEIVAQVEQLKGEKWEAFRDRQGDLGRDAVLYLGRVQGGLRLRQLGERAGLDYACTATALRRLSERSRRDKQLERFLRQATALLSNVKI
jgi:putative transposase